MCIPHQLQAAMHLASGQNARSSEMLLNLNDNNLSVNQLWAGSINSQE